MLKDAIGAPQWMAAGPLSAEVSELGSVRGTADQG